MDTERAALKIVTGFEMEGRLNFLPWTFSDELSLFFSPFFPHTPNLVSLIARIFPPCGFKIECKLNNSLPGRFSDDYSLYFFKKNSKTRLTHPMMSDRPKRHAVSNREATDKLLDNRKRRSSAQVQQEKKMA